MDESGQVRRMNAVIIIKPTEHKLKDAFVRIARIMGYNVVEVTIYKERDFNIHDKALYDYGKVEETVEKLEKNGNNIVLVTGVNSTLKTMLEEDFGAFTLYLARNKAEATGLEAQCDKAIPEEEIFNQSKRFLKCITTL